jgi:hypothetical protein
MQVRKGGGLRSGLLFGLCVAKKTPKHAVKSSAIELPSPWVLPDEARKEEIDLPGFLFPT